MDLKVQTFAVKAFVAFDMDSSVFEIAENLAKLKIDAAPVINRNGDLFGIVTRADIIQLIASEASLKGTFAWEVCSHELVYVSPDDTAIEACQIMRDRGIHHLVVGTVGDVVGMISSMDIIEKLLDPDVAAALLRADAP